MIMSSSQQSLPTPGEETVSPLNQEPSRMKLIGELPDVLTQPRQLEPMIDPTGQLHFRLDRADRPFDPVAAKHTSWMQQAEMPLV